MDWARVINNKGDILFFCTNYDDSNLNYTAKQVDPEHRWSRPIDPDPEWPPWLWLGLEFRIRDMI